MKIAVPVVNGKLSMHFGHCEHFALLDVDTDQKKILSEEQLPSPPHQPGMLPLWLAEREASIIIAGGMGQRAQMLFAQHGIKVVVGAASATPQELVQNYLDQNLVVGDNICDH